MIDTPLHVGDFGNPREPRVHGVAPDHGLPGLVLELREDLVVAALVDQAFERFPLVDVSGHGLGAFVMRVVNGLDHGLAGFQLVGIRHVMQE